MAFLVTPRTLLHLGRDLISSDEVALFEIIKNSLDAKASRTTVSVVQTAPVRALEAIRDALESVNPDGEAAPWRQLAAEASINSGFTSREIAHLIDSGESREVFLRHLDELNYIDVSDNGHGMSLADLEQIYLVIGTPHRAQQQDTATSDAPAIFGEKGIGRLAVMRLGRKLQVRTTTAADTHWNILDVDWSVFDTLDQSRSLSDIPVEPRRGEVKSNPAAHGTTIHISDLGSDWSVDRLQALAESHFHRFTDPFVPGSRRDIRLLLNGERVHIPRFTRILFENAHANLSATFDPNGPGGPRFFGTFEYRLDGTVNDTFEVTGEHLLTAAKCSDVATLKALGPFKVVTYWYNRQRIRALDGIGKRDDVRKVVRQWAGGLAVYRDELRVLPYATPDDDWLGLDPKALGASGYKMNRAQLIGAVQISRRANPQLIDKSNREGLRNTPEQSAFVAVLQHLLVQRFRPFLNRAKTATRPADTDSYKAARSRAAAEASALEKHVKRLLRTHREVRADAELVDGLRHGVKTMRELAGAVQALERAREEEHGKLLHLAGTGMMVEIVAHELNRASRQALESLEHVDASGLSSETKSALRLLKAQFKTLRKRLRLLDPLGTASRQVRKTFDLTRVCKDIIATHGPQFERHGISAVVRVTGKSKRFRVRAVEGMVVQILENLVSNSVYWLRVRSRLVPDHPLTVTIVINPETRELRLSDTGPGIPAGEAERVFEAFFSTKPADELSGLGLFIARGIAEYHGMKLFVAEPDDDERCRTFVLGPFESKE